MSEVTLDMKAVGGNKGFNKYALLRTKVEDAVQQYEEVLEQVEGSLTTVADNDTLSKLQVAITKFEPFPEQIEKILKFQKSFDAIEDQIDPERLQFEVDKAADDEICIFRKSEHGVSNIVINEDGSVALSFIAFKGASKTDVFSFYEAHEEADFESFVLTFFSL